MGGPGDGDGAFEKVERGFCSWREAGQVVGQRVGVLGEFAGDGDDLAERGVVADDLGVPGGAAGVGRVRGEQVERAAAAGFFDEPGAVEDIGDGVDVDPVVVVVQLRDGGVYVLVGGLVEVAGLERPDDGVARVA